MPDIQSILQRYWGHDAFRPQQKAIIQSVLGGKDTLALLPTGGGKSVCYQVPAMAMEGICIVVSPLIALMKDQVDNLKKRGIAALLIHSGMQKKDVIRTLENARQPYFKFLYVSPERLETDLFKEYLPALQVNLIAVDEAHCISQWGYDFRPSYLKIGVLREELLGVPVLAVTASATAIVQDDIARQLHFNKANFFRQSFERKNLSYSVFKVDAKINKMLEVLKNVPGSAIVYCKTRKRTTEIASLLKMHGLQAAFYHAGLLPEERSARQQGWINNGVRIIVCTNAFGMGIDKPDVRTVIHADVPDCLENYYQEAGRCGRDGKKAYAVLLYDEKDVEQLEELHLLRYPAVEVIKTVYDALVNYLQIPLHGGMNCQYNFRLDEFVRNFKLDARQVLPVLQALEADGWIDYNEKNFIPSSLMFVTNKEMLYAFYEAHPQYEDLLVTLLRTYEGIFDFPVFINEILVARLLKEDENEIKEKLKQVTAFGIVRYVEQNDAPQIFFKKNRVAAADLQINVARYNQRKEIFVQRIKTIIAYLQTTGCRSSFINKYFGEEKNNDCGICDNCRSRLAKSITPAEFNNIAILIKSKLHQQAITATQLLQQLQVNKEKAWQVLQFLQSEKTIVTKEDGLLQYVSK